MKIITILCTTEVAEEYIFRFYECPMRRRTWNSIKHVEPIILDRTRSFKQPQDMKYPVVNSDLFAELGYNHATDDFEYVRKYIKLKLYNLCYYLKYIYFITALYGYS